MDVEVVVEVEELDAASASWRLGMMARERIRAKTRRERDFKTD